MSDEITAMRMISDVLEKLNMDEQSRVLTWATAKFCPGLKSPNAPTNHKVSSPEKSTQKFLEFADLYYAATPKDHGERALVASYWLSLTNEGQSFPSQSVNLLLKNLGFAVPNITDALTQCMKEKPATIIQTKKVGSTRQGRKLYKLTDAGLKRVQNMVERGSHEPH